MTPRVSKLRVIEISGKSSGLVSTSRYSWLVVRFLSEVKILVQFWGAIVKFREIDNFFPILRWYISININRSDIKLSPACSSFNSEQHKSVVTDFWWNVCNAQCPGREQRHPHRQNRLKANLVHCPWLASDSVERHYKHVHAKKLATY